jgi:hypothetical protein
MTLRDRVQELLGFFQTNPPVRQIYERFYDENVIVQENMQPPRVGREMSIDRQEQMNANVKEVHDFKLGAVLVDGFDETHPLDGRSVVEMQIELTTLDGHRIRLEELGMQTWKDGKIVRERYFYDPSGLEGKAKEINAIH